VPPPPPVCRSVDVEWIRVAWVGPVLVLGTPVGTWLLDSGLAELGVGAHRTDKEREVGYGLWAGHSRIMGPWEWDAGRRTAARLAWAVFRFSVSLKPRPTPSTEILRN
jgi:hypothetical protein